MVLVAVTVFMLGDGLLRASAFMIGLAVVPVVLGVLLDSYLDRYISFRGPMPRLRGLFDRIQFRYWQRT